MMSPPQHQTLSSSNAGAGASGIAGYLFNEKASAEAKTGYYLRGEAPSQWLGRGAAAMGLQGAVERERFMEMLQGRFPDGSDLSERIGGNGTRRAGSDVTWSPPKSFSCHAVHDPRLQALWREALTYMVGLMEQEVAHARNGKGGADVEHTGNLIVAAFEHEDARPVNGRVTPDWHAHLYLINATRRADGKLTALHQEWGRERLKLLDFAGKARLAQGVQELGYEIRVTADGFEIVGMSRAQIEHMSPRKGQIDKALKERGLTRENSTSGQRDTANLSTREDKRQIGRDEQHWEWRRELRELGLNMDQMRRDAEARGPIDIEDHTAEAVEYAADHLGERDTVYRRDQARLEALRAGMGKTTLEQIDAEITGNEAYISEGLDMTTRRALEREHRVVENVRADRGQARALMTDDAAAEFVAEVDKNGKFALTPGQREALTLALTSDDKTLIVRGAAGVGKTKAILQNFVERGARAQGYEVIGLAPTSSAEAELRDATGPDRKQTRTLASFLAAPPRKMPDRSKRIFIIDEAGMVGDRDMDRLQRKIAADYPGARVILTGDHRQIDSPEAGRPLERMIEGQACAIADVRDVVRQQDPALLELAQSLADDRLDDAVRQIKAFTNELDVPPDLDKQGKPKLDKDGRPKLPWKRKCKALAEAGAQAYMGKNPETRRETLMMSPTNSVRRQINDRVRSELIKQGEVDTRTRAILTVANKADTTRAQRGNGLTFQPGMHVSLRDGRESRSHEVIEVRERDSVMLRDAQGREWEWNPREQRAESATRHDTLSVSPGDRLVTTGIQQIAGERVQNGAVLDVAHIDEAKHEVVCRVVNDENRELRLPMGQAGLAVDRGWAVTFHKAQGKSPMHAQVVTPMTDRVSAQLLNVGATRGVRSLEVVTDSSAALEKQLSKWQEVQTAQGLADRREQAQAKPIAAVRERIADGAARQQERPVSAPVHEPEAKQKEQVHVRERTRED